MLYAYQAGIKPGEFYDNTIAENMRMIAAHQLNEYKQDSRVRLLGYWSLLPHRNKNAEIDYLELMPLYFDDVTKNNESDLKELIKWHEEERQRFEQEQKLRNG